MRCFGGISGILFGVSPPFNHLSGPVSRDTARLSQRYPPITRYGLFGVSAWPIGCDTPSPFSERFPLGEHAKWRCDTPPSKGYLSDAGAIPYENKANGCDTPLRDTISKGYCAIWGGISPWAAKLTINCRQSISGILPSLKGLAIVMFLCPIPLPPKFRAISFAVLALALSLKSFQEIHWVILAHFIVFLAFPTRRTQPY